jgi:hypothetical protein
MNGIHPAPANFTAEQISTDPILHFFHYAHLPAALQSASSPFCALASLLVTTLPRNAERTVALRKLLEAKDAAVRANVGGAKETTFEDRLKAERDDLKGRLDKLKSFLAGEQVGASPVQVSMLVEQKDAMEDYLGILNARLENLADAHEGVRLEIDPEEGRSDPHVIGDFRESPPEFFKG